MESSGLSPADFFQLTVDSLLKLRTHCIDGHCIVSIEGRLLLTLDNGDKFELNILPDEVGSLTEADDIFSVCHFILSYSRINSFIIVNRFNARVVSSSLTLVSSKVLKLSPFQTSKVYSSA